MTKSKSHRWIVVAAAVSWLLAGSVEACQCDFSALIDHFDDADAVFLGRIMEQEPPTGTYRRVNFQVSKAWKGVTGSEVGLRVGTGLIYCDFWGEVGQEYLVHARVPEPSSLQWDVLAYFPDVRLTTSDCTTWGQRRQADYHIADLERAGIQPIELHEGPDDRWPAGPLSDDPEAEEASLMPYDEPEDCGLCGTGLFAAALIAIPLACTLRQRPGPGVPAEA